MERTFQTLTLMNFHELMEIESNFQQPSSSESPLTQWIVTENNSPVLIEIL